jgi:ribulose-phosphate 3-epimerase
MINWSTLPQGRLLADYSLWSANLAALGESIRATEPYADLYHIDVADAHFVPGLIFFPDLVAALRPLTDLPFHVHLMTEHPADLAPAFVDAGADIVTVHVDSENLDDAEAKTAIEIIRRNDRAAGVALQLETSTDVLEDLVDELSVVLMMGTPLGVKGVGLDDRAPERIRTVKKMLEARGLADAVKVSADGGIRDHTVPALRAAGADMITPGSLVFKSDDLAATTRWLHDQA